MFERVITIINRAGLIQGQGWRRVAFEKPFGYDTPSAKQLNDAITDVFGEDQIYRIDHYLGKELVQNILTLRFANALFENVWNCDFIDHVQITVAEQGGVETRGGYYDKSGAVRDMLQNHLLQILCLTAMDSPSSLQADAIHNQKIKVLNAIRSPESTDLVLGQYGPGNHKPGYRQEHDVPEDSKTETFIAARLYIDNKRWKDVPFYLRTGKALAKRYAEVNVVLKDVSCPLFSQNGVCLPRSNVITIRIQPDEGISVRFNAKKPGASIALQEVAMDFCHHCLFALNTPEAYEVLLQHLMEGDQTLFTRWDSVLASWEYIDQVKTLLNSQKHRFPNYEAGSMGPKETDSLLANLGHQWIGHRPIQ
jgi:glucose-6-phosphate 1-dehydrogenase